MAQLFAGVAELRVATLLVGDGVGICVLGFVVEASDEAGGGASLFHIFIGFHTRLLGLQLLAPQPGILQPVLEAIRPKARQVANFKLVKRVLRMAGESFLSPQAARPATTSGVFWFGKYSAAWLMQSIPD